MAITAGTHLGRYEIRSKIGAGGMGDVYLAQDTKLDRKVALKILPSDLAANQGKKAEAQRVLDELKELSTKQHVSPYSIAIIYAGLGDKDQAFEWLNKAYDQRSFFIALLKVETVLDNLRPDPRFNVLLKRANLPE